ncbi:MAG: hypothetical protein KJ880_00250 [Candidatus Omnitrophica bacterium]|nr:hypothetical protein [Candidatus Omnitrophota bacterium]MBU1870449.1 hypothetical protein [Candidatus Omnitrophota bacterium]
MDNSVFIARIFGLCYLIIGAGFLFNRKAFEQVMEDFCKNAAVVFYGGLLALVIGVVIILTHNVWAANWTVIITIIGWLALIKGIWLIVFPNTVYKFMQAYQKNKSMQIIHPIVALILGAILSFLGFFAG